jgi:hypothetical protein
MFKNILVWTFIIASVMMSIHFVFGWSNGGYSTDPASPKYGTHDWIAQHALDWLPIQEKQDILNNMANYLYGTELPDNANAPDGTGIGDSSKHHVYFYVNTSLQDPSGAARAQEEYDIALDYVKMHDWVNASKTLGAMTHYISDLAVFGHVMGADADWDAEVHHSDYEDYVETRTDNYTDTFNSYLTFDGDLANTSPYDAALTLAFNTTFGDNGNYNCTWMDQNYNWTNQVFKSRMGESLNLAVNLVADVLHTFTARALISEYPVVWIAPVFMMITLLTTLVYKRKRPELHHCSYELFVILPNQIPNFERVKTP